MYNFSSTPFHLKNLCYNSWVKAPVFLTGASIFSIFTLRESYLYLKHKRAYDDHINNHCGCFYNCWEDRCFFHSHYNQHSDYEYIESKGEDHDINKWILLGRKCDEHNPRIYLLILGGIFLSYSFYKNYPFKNITSTQNFNLHLLTLMGYTLITNKLTS